MKGYLLFVDVETSGMPSSIKSPITRLDKWPYLIQIAWQIYDFERNLIKTENHFVYEEGISIDIESQKIHGITLDELRIKGKPRRLVIERFIADYNYYNPILVGHFVELDHKMLQVAMIRSGLENILADARSFCTMIASKAMNPFKKGKYLKLEELYNRLFVSKIDRTHDALLDVQATVKCYFQLAEQRLLEIGQFSQETKSNPGKSSLGCGLPFVVLLILIFWMIL
ncbi:3'-5' exonuclease [Marinoscillum sp. MHG1-6]|uniref:3'-5' exonuclease n=1 Tax=Marinoscillum sp. MHG1-6 TaxID=2959627 RepID=UPI0021581FE4|nr:3'-5' exonuclease [Marinoscillum sp. MHG1-6]